MTSRARLDHVAVLINPHSRRGALALTEVEQQLRRLAGRVDVVPIESGSQVARAAREAAALQPDLLVVGGGDGSIGAAAGAIAHTPVVLGVLPLGTANDFARTLDIPAEVAAAVQNLVAGKVVDVDLGRVDGRPFVNVASLGLAVAVTAVLSPTLKKRLGPAAYAVAGLRAYRGFTPFQARLEFPDGDLAPLDLDGLLQVAIGNGRHFGGGNTISPTASLDDHLLDIIAVRRGRRTAELAVARRIRSGALVEHDLVHHVTTRRVRLHTGEPHPINLDGEIVAATPAEFWVERNAVLVVVPEHSTAARHDPH